MEQVYKFNRQLKIGEVYEKVLDSFYADEYDIRAAADDEQPRGIDRWFTHRKNGRSYSVQYKTDERAHSTGNGFIETISVDSTGAAGWVFTCEADYLFYYLPQFRAVLIFKPARLRAAVALWQSVYPTGRSRNDGYHTCGLLIPLDELENCVVAVHRFVRVKAV